MNEMICEKCGGEINAESGAVFSVCGKCGANAQLPVEKTAASGETAPKPKKKNLSPAIFVAICLTALLTIGLFAGGAYWLVNKSVVVKPTPRPTNHTSISPTEIVQIEYTDSNYRVQYPAQYLTNYTPKYYFTRESHVTLISDGRAKKYLNQMEIANGVRSPDRSERHTGAFAPERFAELARILVENDFLGEKDSKTSTISPVNQTITVVCSSQVKTFQVGDSVSDTPEAEAMLQAFKNLENKIDWQKQE